MNKTKNIFTGLTIGSLAIYLLTYYSVILFIRIKIGYWPKYDNPSSGNFKIAVYENIFLWSLIIFYLSMIILVLLDVISKKYLKAVLSIILFILFCYFQLYLNPFQEWYAD